MNKISFTSVLQNKSSINRQSFSSSSSSSHHQHQQQPHNFQHQHQPQSQPQFQPQHQFPQTYPQSQCQQLYGQSLFSIFNTYESNPEQQYTLNLGAFKPLPHRSNSSNNLHHQMMINSRNQLDGQMDLQTWIESQKNVQQQHGQQQYGSCNNVVYYQSGLGQGSGSGSGSGSCVEQENYNPNLNHHQNNVNRYSSSSKSSSSMTMNSRKFHQSQNQLQPPQQQQIQPPQSHSQQKQLKFSSSNKGKSQSQGQGQSQSQSQVYQGQQGQQGQNQVQTSPKQNQNQSQSQSYTSTNSNPKTSQQQPSLHRPSQASFTKQQQEFLRQQSEKIAQVLQSSKFISNNKGNNNNNDTNNDRDLSSYLPSKQKLNEILSSAMDGAYEQVESMAQSNPNNGKKQNINQQLLQSQSQLLQDIQQDNQRLKSDNIIKCCQDQQMIESKRKEQIRFKIMDYISEINQAKSQAKKDEQRMKGSKQSSSPAVEGKSISSIKKSSVNQQQHQHQQHHQQSSFQQQPQSQNIVVDNQVGYSFSNNLMMMMNGSQQQQNNDNYQNNSNDNNNNNFNNNNGQYSHGNTACEHSFNMQNQGYTAQGQDGQTHYTGTITTCQQPSFAAHGQYQYVGYQYTDTDTDTDKEYYQSQQFEQPQQPQQSQQSQSTKQSLKSSQIFIKQSINKEKEIKPEIYQPQQEEVEEVEEEVEEEQLNNLNMNMNMNLKKNKNQENIINNNKWGQQKVILDNNHHHHNQDHHNTFSNIDQICSQQCHQQQQSMSQRLDGMCNDKVGVNDVNTSEIIQDIHCRHRVQSQPQPQPQQRQHYFPLKQQYNQPTITTPIVDSIGRSPKNNDSINSPMTKIDDLTRMEQEQQEQRRRKQLDDRRLKEIMQKSRQIESCNVSVQQQQQLHKNQIQSFKVSVQQYQQQKEKEKEKVNENENERYSIGLNGMSSCGDRNTGFLQSPQARPALLASKRFQQSSNNKNTSNYATNSISKYASARDIKSSYKKVQNQANKVSTQKISNFTEQFVVEEDTHKNKDKLPQPQSQPQPQSNYQNTLCPSSSNNPISSNGSLLLSMKPIDLMMTNSRSSNNYDYSSVGEKTATAKEVSSPVATTGDVKNSLIYKEQQKKNNQHSYNTTTNNNPKSSIQKIMKSSSSSNTLFQSQSSHSQLPVRKSITKIINLKSSLASSSHSRANQLHSSKENYMVNMNVGSSSTSINNNVCGDNIGFNNIKNSNCFKDNTQMSRKPTTTIINVNQSTTSDFDLALDD